MAVQVRLLGSFEVVGSDGSQVDLGSPKQRAVLALLAIDAGKVVSLERIVDQLWGDEPPARAEGTVHAYISNLRRALEPDRPARAPSTVLVSRSPGYLLAVPPDSIDAAECERTVAEGRRLLDSDPEESGRLLRDALALWRGPALADFTYEAFAAAEIARLEELRLDAVETRIAADLAAGKTGELVGELERLVTEHPLRERLWGHLMLALYRAGRQADALRAYRRCREQLVEELGIEPGADLRALEQAILDQDPGLNRPVRATPAISTDRETYSSEGEDLVGREVEIDIFGDALTDAAAGRGSVLLLEGEPGIGKTRLLEAMHGNAEQAGIPAVLARCVEVGGTPPFWPWIQLGRGLTGIFGEQAVVEAAGAYRRYLAPVFPELSPDDAGAAGLTDAAPHRVAEGILAALRQLTRERPLVLLIDDLYGADPDSFTVLTLMAAEVSRLGLVIACTYRSVDVPDRHPLTEVLAHTTRIDRVTRLPLQRLSRGEVGDLIAHIAGEDVEPAVVEAVHARTGGNAFFTVELVRLLVSEGDLTVEGCARATVPTTVRDVLRQRLSRFDDDTIHMLRVAAVCGRRWDVDTVTAVLGGSKGTVLDQVDRAAAAGLVVEDGTPGSYRFSHVLVGDTIAHALGSLRRAQLHHEIAAALEESRGADAASWAEIAHHATEAVPVTGPEEALEPLARAGRHALESHAHELAERLLDRRLALVESMPASTRRDQAEIQAWLDIARVASWREGYQSDRLERAGRRILELAGVTAEIPGGVPGDDASGSSNRLVEVVLPALQARSIQLLVSGEVAANLDTVALLDELVSMDPDPGPMLLWNRNMAHAVGAVHSGDAVTAIQRFDEVDPLVDAADPGRTGTVLIPLGLQSLLSTHHAFAGWARWLAGEPVRAREELALARAAADRLGGVYNVGFVTAIAILVAAMDDDPDAAADYLAWARSYQRIADYLLAGIWMEGAQAWVDGRRGDPAGVDRLRATIARIEDMGARVCHTQYWGMVAQLALDAGRPGEALEAAHTGLDQVARRGEGYWEPELERLQALALRDLGRDAEADGALERAASAADRRGIVSLARRVAATKRRSS